MPHSAGYIRHEYNDTNDPQNTEKAVTTIKKSSLARRERCLSVADGQPTKDLMVDSG